MDHLLTHNPAALRILMTEDLFLVKEKQLLQETYVKTDVKQAQEAIQTNFSYLGENNKYFLILVNDEKHAHLNKEHQETLLKIIQAKGLELRDIAILNLNSCPDVTFKTLKEFFAPARIVLFGIDPKTIGLPAASSNELLQTEDVKFLATYHFEEMKDDVNKKREFWNAFKSL